MLLRSFEKILGRYVNHERQCFIDYIQTSNFVEKTPLRVAFSTFLSVFGHPDETLSLAFDIYYVLVDEL